MNRVLAVAWREFVSTALTKGFIIGAVVVPLAFIAMIPVIVMLVMAAKGPSVEGDVAVLDRSGVLLSAVERELSAEAVAARRNRTVQAVAEQMEQLGPIGGGGQEDSAPAKAAIAAAAGEIPTFHVVPLAAGTDLDAEKALLSPTGGDERRLAIAVLAPDAVIRAPDADSFGGYELFVRPKLDDRIISEIRSGLNAAILRERYQANGFSPEEIRRLTTVAAAQTREVTATGERKSTQELTAMLPFGFILLLMISAMVGGQYLLTTTVEEKSSRVVEVLLSAVSPMQLMTGKILGQMGVGFVLLFMYTGLGTGALAAFGLMDLIGPVKLLYLFVFFVLAYLMLASFMAAVGSAVNEMREAQSLMGPVMIVVMLPYILWLPITRDPNSTLSVVLSLVPPMSPFAMVMRLTSTQADVIPTWQVLLSIGVSAAGAYLSVWAAAKVFRVGLLMFGKPPNFRTLIRWVRMA
ncbi:MAG: ABC transporter permease [Phycisphaeraceae bacterium]|nr:ABC transporter permease [Phycisphaeraceae bacterium]